MLHRKLSINTVVLHNPLKKAYFLEYAYFHQLHECNLVTVRLFFLTACMLDFEYIFKVILDIHLRNVFFDFDIK